MLPLLIGKNSQHHKWKIPLPHTLSGASGPHPLRLSEKCTEKDKTASLVTVAIGTGLSWPTVIEIRQRWTEGRRGQHVYMGQADLKQQPFLFLPGLPLCLISSLHKPITQNNRHVFVCVCVRDNDSMCTDGRCSAVFTVGVITHSCFDKISFTPQSLIRTAVMQAEQVCYGDTIFAFNPENIQGVFKDSSDTTAADSAGSLFSNRLWCPTCWLVELFIQPAWSRRIKAVTGVEVRWGEERQGRKQILSKVWVPV